MSKGVMQIEGIWKQCWG